jgi:hypothetical protein
MSPRIATYKKPISYVKFFHDFINTYTLILEKPKLFFFPTKSFDIVIHIPKLHVFASNIRKIPSSQK